MLTFSFLSYIHAWLRSSLENHTWFQTKMGKLYTCFQTKTTQKPYLIGRHIKGVPSPPPVSLAVGRKKKYIQGVIYISVVLIPLMISEI